MANFRRPSGRTVGQVFALLLRTETFGYQYTLQQHKRGDIFTICICHSISLSGEHNRNVNEGSEQRFKAKRAFTHPKYNKQPLDSDIALIKLDRPVRFNSRIQPICLPRDGRSAPPGSLCYITGKCMFHIHRGYRYLNVFRCISLLWQRWNLLVHLWKFWKWEHANNIDIQKITVLQKSSIELKIKF